MNSRRAWMLMVSPLAHFGGRGIDDRANLAHGVDWNSAAPRVLANDVLVLGVVHAVDLVGGDIAVDPLHVGSQSLEHLVGLRGDVAKILGGQLPGAGDGSFDEVLTHFSLPFLASTWRR